MATIERFEDIVGWQKGRELTNFVYAITRQQPFGRDLGLRDQIRRASISLMSNIAEGFGRESNRSLANFCPSPKLRPARFNRSFTSPSIKNTSPPSSSIRATNFAPTPCVPSAASSLTLKKRLNDGLVSFQWSVRQFSVGQLVSGQLIN
jgi:hypothetical protein